MTTDQIGYRANLETARSNRAREFETHRSNVAKEYETNRSNLVHEKQEQQRLDEQHRNNLEIEAQGRAGLTETNRSNLENEKIKWAQLNEQARSNRAGEGLQQQQIDETGRSNRANEKLKREQTVSQLAGQKYSADSSRSAAKYSADSSASASKYSADTSFKGTKATNASNRDIAQWRARVDQAISDANNQTKMDVAEMQDITNRFKIASDNLNKQKELNQRDAALAKQLKQEAAKLDEAVRHNKTTEVISVLGGIKDLLGRMSQTGAQVFGSLLAAAG